MRHHSFHVLGEGVVGLLNIFLTSYLGIVLSNHFKFWLKAKRSGRISTRLCKCVSELVESLLSMFNVVQQHVYRWQGTVFLVEEM